jgi:hypothetical protein
MEFCLTSIFSFSLSFWEFFAEFRMFLVYRLYGRLFICNIGATGWDIKKPQKQEKAGL